MELLASSNKSPFKSQLYQNGFKNVLTGSFERTYSLSKQIIQTKRQIRTIYNLKLGSI
jgi:hypothetical protein